MSISSASLLSSATVSATGGTALPFASAGIVGEQNEIYATGDTDLRTRRSIVCSVKKPKVNASAPNGYTQARSQMLFKFPLELDNGAITINTVRVETSTDVETTQGEVDEYHKVVAQSLFDTDFDEFRRNLSLS